MLLQTIGKRMWQLQRVEKDQISSVTSRLNVTCVFVLSSRKIQFDCRFCSQVVQHLETAKAYLDVYKNRAQQELASLQSINTTMHRKTNGETPGSRAIATVNFGFLSPLFLNRMSDVFQQEMGYLDAVRDAIQEGLDNAHRYPKLKCSFHSMVPDKGLLSLKNQQFPDILCQCVFLKSTKPKKQGKFGYIGVLVDLDTISKLKKKDLSGILLVQLFVLLSVFVKLSLA